MNTKSIKQKMKSVGNIKKITRTMEMVSVAKMKKSSDAALAYRPFINNARETLTALYTDQSIKHSLLSDKSHNLVKDKEKILIILIGADKGLCGGYNAQLYKAMQKIVKGDQSAKDESLNNAPDVAVIAVGRYAERIAKRFTQNIVYAYPKNSISNREASIIVKESIKRYTDTVNDVDKVMLIHPYIYSGISYRVETKQILPYIDIETKDLVNQGKVDKDNLYNYEPDVETIVSAIVPLLLESMILAAVLETEAGEHAARMMAMKTASDNAGDMLHDLKLNYNNARQAKITQEIAELSSVA